MSGLTERLWEFINGIVSIAGFAITSLLILGSIFSSGIRSNVTDLYYSLISSGIIGLYVFIMLTYTLFIAVMDVFFAIYNAGGINRNLIPKIISVKTKSTFEAWMSKAIYIFSPIAIFIYIRFFFT
ncbi:hypothetical protein OAW69_03615 [Gammaproteobacteria bacterium]|nr:hypothetical protein [Gammaproteobacteria bacterium]